MKFRKLTLRALTLLFFVTLAPNAHAVIVASDEEYNFDFGTVSASTTPFFDTTYKLYSPSLDASLFWEGRGTLAQNTRLTFSFSAGYLNDSGGLRNEYLAIKASLGDGPLHSMRANREYGQGGIAPVLITSTFYYLPSPADAQFMTGNIVIENASSVSQLFYTRIFSLLAFLNDEGTMRITGMATSIVPIPGALFLFGTGLLGLGAMRRKYTA